MDSRRWPACSPCRTHQSGSHPRNHDQLRVGIESVAPTRRVDAVEVAGASALALLGEGAPRNGAYQRHRVLPALSSYLIRADCASDMVRRRSCPSRMPHAGRNGASRCRPKIASMPAGSQGADDEPCVSPAAIPEFLYSVVIVPPVPDFRVRRRCPQAAPLRFPRNDDPVGGARQTPCIID